MRKVDIDQMILLEISSHCYWSVLLGHLFECGTRDFCKEVVVTCSTKNRVWDCQCNDKWDFSGWCDMAAKGSHFTCGLWFKSWKLHLWFTYLLMTWEKQWKMVKLLIHIGNLNDAVGFWIQPGTVLAAAARWKWTRRQQIEDIFFSL